MGVTVLQGDCRVVLATLPAESVQCVVTSPPYFGLRSYNGGDAEVGTEGTPQEYVTQLVGIFREIWRVLRKDGVAWLNLGDSYSGGGPHHGTTNLGKTGSNKGSATGRDRIGFALGVKPKDLMMVPARVAIALCDDGWYLRQDIVWSKAAPMPESVTDRCTKSHEYVFLLAKSQHYYFDADAIAEPVACDRPRGRFSDYEHVPNGGANDGLRQMAARMHEGDAPLTRNKRSVWHLGPEPIADAHFAVMPSKLAEPCILAGSRVGDMVLDPFAGSGTTGRVATKHRRDAVLIELNPDYCELIEKRTSRVQQTLPMEDAS